MFKFLKRNKITSAVNSFTSLVGSDTIIGGPITTKGSIQVNGVVNGDITGMATSNPTIVAISKTGVVNGNITCDVAIIEGFVEGSIDACEVCIHSTAVFSKEHTITYEILQIMPGANVSGELIKKDSVQKPGLVIPQPQ